MPEPTAIYKYPSFYFDGYTLRPAKGDADRALAEMWMEADRWHATQFDPAFWLEQTALVNSFVLEDALAPVFFFRTELPPLRVPRPASMNVELYIQFAPNEGATRLRTMKALSAGFEWLKKKLGAVGYDAVFFTSRNPRLIEFAQRRLEFTVCAELEAGTRLKAYLKRAA